MFSEIYKELASHMEVVKDKVVKIIKEAEEIKKTDARLAYGFLKGSLQTEFNIPTEAGHMDAAAAYVYLIKEEMNENNT